MRTAFIEETPRLDVRELGLDQDQDTVAIRVHGQMIRVTREKCGYTVRPWFRCPDCGKRTARVYLFRERWACRDCHGLMYASQWRTKEQRLQHAYEALLPDVLEGRPKGQHRRKHYRRVSRFLAIQEVLLQASVQRLTGTKQRFLKGIDSQTLWELELARVDL